MFEHKDMPASIALCSPSLYRVLRGNNYLTLVRTNARTADPPLSFVLSLHPLYFGFLFFCHFFSLSLSFDPCVSVSLVFVLLLYALVRTCVRAYIFLLWPWLPFMRWGRGRRLRSSCIGSGSDSGPHIYSNTLTTQLTTFLLDKI